MLGNRWQPGTSNSEMLCRIAGKYMDVISINYYTLGVDRAFIERLHRWTGDKPQMWSEFNYTSGAESNVAPSALDLGTQRLRGQAYRTYIEQAASLGFVVGSEWFTLIDQAVTGHFSQLLNGERSNSGIFNVADRPYRDMVAEVAAAHRELYDVWLAGKAPFSIDDPRFHAGAASASASASATAVKHLQAGHALGAIAIDGSLTQWPGRPPELIGSERLVVGADGTGFGAAVKLCWDQANLYVLAQVSDPTPLMNTSQGKELWNGDGLELFIGAEHGDGAGGLLPGDRQVLLAARRALPGAGDPWYVVNAARQPDIRLIAVPSVEGAGYTLEAAIPWSALGVTPQENLELLFDLAVDDGDGHGRTRQADVERRRARRAGAHRLGAAAARAVSRRPFATRFLALRRRRRSALPQRRAEAERGVQGGGAHRCMPGRRRRQGPRFTGSSRMRALALEQARMHQWGRCDFDRDERPAPFPARPGRRRMPHMAWNAWRGRNAAGRSDTISGASQLPLLECLARA